MSQPASRAALLGQRITHVTFVGVQSWCWEPSISAAGQLSVATQNPGDVRQQALECRASSLQRPLTIAVELRRVLPEQVVADLVCNNHGQCSGVVSLVLAAGAREGVGSLAEGGWRQLHRGGVPAAGAASARSRCCALVCALSSVRTVGERSPRPRHSRGSITAYTCKRRVGELQLDCSESECSAHRRRALREFEVRKWTMCRSGFIQYNYAARI